MAERERSTEDIRQDIAEKEENISQTVEEIGERLKEKLDWRAYARNYPYWMLGTAAGLGYFTSRMIRTRSSPLERVMGSIAEEFGYSRGGRKSKVGLIKATLVGVATKAAVDWVKSATSRVWTNDNVGVPPRTGGS